ncbi:MAG: YceI family protein, partial [Pseudomonadota bacterium]
MFKTAIAIAAACVLTSTAVLAETAKPAALDVPAGTYKLDATHASLTWKVSHLGLSNYTARFSKFDATLDFDPAKMDQSKLTVTIDPKSIKTDYPLAATKDFDKKLAEDPEYFNANAHPEITFVSTAVEMTGEKTAKVSGDLTLLGVTKEIRVRDNAEWYDYRVAALRRERR